MEQLRARYQELEDAHLQLELERAKLERKIERRRDGGRACAISSDVNRRIVEDDEGLPHIARASQNIATMVALLERLSKLMTPEDHRAHCEIRTLLERATVQQAERSLSW